jgi:hypothetical protein
MEHPDFWSGILPKVEEAIEDGVRQYENNILAIELILSQLKDRHLDKVLTQENIVQCGFEIDNVLYAGYKNFDELVDFVIHYDKWWKVEKCRMIFYPRQKISYLEFSVGVAKSFDEKGDEKWMIL